MTKGSQLNSEKSILFLSLNVFFLQAIFATSTQPINYDFHLKIQFLPYFSSYPYSVWDIFCVSASSLPPNISGNKSAIPLKFCYTFLTLILTNCHNWNFDDVVTDVMMSSNVSDGIQFLGKNTKNNVSKMPL